MYFLTIPPPPTPPALAIVQLKQISTKPPTEVPASLDIDG